MDVSGTVRRRAGKGFIMAKQHNAAGRCMEAGDFPQLENERNRDLYDSVVGKVNASNCEECKRALKEYLDSKKESVAK